jgi:alanyl-tRNA synthetase/REP element-mobilizing transposase RayT
VARFNKLTMTSSQIRQSFLDFFKSNQHTVVPSSSLLPDSPNLLFTNAGMNQFVPIFLGQVKCPYTPGRAADTQKCIRAGGKHNDLEDVGLDTYHHTFFEMLGNWSFGDYFKKEAIEWAWELITEVWKFPQSRLYATVYQPGPGEPSEFDQEAYDHWARLFRAAGLDPKVHICTGGKKDNFWMMGDTGPCGPCSELHVDLTPNGDTKGALVNKGSAQCIEIWNLVFMQFNANPDGTFSPLPARSVDTGMGFERVTGIIQNTKGFTDFSRVISNYETDIFRPIFDKLEQLSGKRYGSTLPQPSSTGSQPVNVGQASSLLADDGAGKMPALHHRQDACATNEQIACDIAFRVIADHIRTLSFAIADGIQPGNTDRNYVLRRILRRAVRYGRTLGFHEPFFYKLVDVLAETMGEVFPEIRAKQRHVQEVIRVEEEAFNKTLDKGIALFNEEAAKVMGSAPATGAADRALAVGTGASDNRGAIYSKRRLPHFERPWGKYMVTFSTHQKRQLAPAERDIVLESVLYAHTHRQYELFAACVMPDHVHLLFEPQIKEHDQDGKPVFYSLGEILQGIKSTTAHRINKAAQVKGVHVWEEESFDRLMRGDADLEEKFHYICRNPWDSGVVALTEGYRWLWTPDQPVAADAPEGSREGAETSARGGRAPQTVSPKTAAPQIAGAFAFRLYDEQGFPLDLTELMARERGLTVDVEGFNRLMDEQKARGRAAQKKTVIELSQIETQTPTAFVGYEKLDTPARVLEVVQLKDKTAVILDTSACYAEMGGQVGDTGELRGGGQLWRIANTQKSGHTWLHLLDQSDQLHPSHSSQDAPPVGATLTLSVDRARRAAIQRHHTVTHLLHWALHEVVSREAAQKGSFVGPDKLTFDFNHAPLTPQQVADVEKLVNERILENAGVSWTEVKYAHVKDRKDIMQFFGDKYGEWVRVVQIGGRPTGLDGYSMELCGGTHTRATGEIGLFRITGENAIAAGVRRIEAIAGLTAYDVMRLDRELIRAVAGRVNSPIHELEKKVESLLEQQKALEKQLKALQQKEAAGAAKSLLSKAATLNGIPAIIEHAGALDGDTLQSLVNELRGQFKGVIVLGGAANNTVALIASVSPEYTAKVQAGKIIQQIAPLVGGKGGGKPDNARGGGKDVAKLDAALAKARSLLG